MVSTAVAGLKQRQAECGYEVKRVVERVIKHGRHGRLKSVIYPGKFHAGDVWIHVGKWLQADFFRHCQDLALKQVYCILYQSDPWDVTAGPGVCEIWEYTHGNSPKAPVVRILPAGFLPIWGHEQNDHEAMKRLSESNVRKLEWVFMGHIDKGNRSKCWNHLKNMPELSHMTFTNHIRGFTQADWKNLARKLVRSCFCRSFEFLVAQNQFPISLASDLTFAAVFFAGEFW